MSQLFNSLTTDQQVIAADAMWWRLKKQNLIPTGIEYDDIQKIMVDLDSIVLTKHQTFDFSAEEQERVVSILNKR